MAYISTSPLHRSLTDRAEKQFRQHAREHAPLDGSDWRVFHPVCRQEWIRVVAEREPEALDALLVALASGDGLADALLAVVAAMRPQEPQEEPGNGAGGVHALRP